MAGKRILVLMLLAATGGSDVRAQVPDSMLTPWDVVTVSASHVGVDRGDAGRNSGGRLLFAVARYHPGDDLAWADPDLDDTGWEIASVGLRADILPQQGWPGIGWFRTRIRLDESLRDHDLAFSFQHAGALEVWLDGRQVYRSGTVGSSPEEEIARVDQSPVEIPFTPGRLHVLALRYSSFGTLGFRSEWSYSGPGVYWGDRETMMRHRTFARFNQGAFSAFILAFALLFALLFRLYRSERLFLYLAWAQGLAVPFIAIGGQIPFVHAPRLVMPLADLSFAFAVAALLAELLLVYAFFRPDRPLQFKVLVLLGVATVAAIAWRLDNVVWFFAFLLLVSLEMLRVVLVALWHRRRWAWIVAVGVIPGIVIQFVDLFESLGMLTAPWSGTPFSPAAISTVLFSTAFATFVGVRFSEAHRGLVELEAARRLQLSMLPLDVPDHPTVQVAARMQTATEVGGDYYDFAVAPDGALAFAIGDATGHGAAAGTLVTATKSLWSAFRDEENLEKVLKRASEAVERMHLKGLYMALAVGRVRGESLEVVGCGLPPALIFRGASGAVEQLPLKGLPLGSPGRATYHARTVELAPGDTALLMTDGFPERFNRAGEMLGYDRMESEFAAVARRSPQEIVDALMARCDAWADGRPPDDDVTFVALRIRG